MPFPIIDLFAGPGGLGEGFSSHLDADDERVFKIALSIEKDDYAHRTLELRAFTREFPVGGIPQGYYQFLEGKITRDELFKRNKDAAERASREAWKTELGKDTPDATVDLRIRAAIGNRVRWVLIGGPPCQAYSLVGRSRIIGEKGREVYDADHRHELYRHYLRILAVHRPPVFVMENVKGLLSAKVKEERIFERILADLKNPVTAMPELRLREGVEYRLVPLCADQGRLDDEFEPEDFIVRAEEFGIPQARHRVIVLGIRSDLTEAPSSLQSGERVSVSQAIGDLPRLRSGLSKGNDSLEAWRSAVRELEAAPWMLNGELDDDLKTSLTTNLRRLGASLERGASFVPICSVPERNADWYSDPNLLGVCNHETRGHITKDLHRYFFAAVFARKHGRSPLLQDFPKALLPDHENVKAALKDTKFNDRFRVQLSGRPSTTVVSHISKDGHYFIHYDCTQCRSLTVREAARLQTFPDNYFFEGPRTEQYKQVGNAVPPLLARQIAGIVAGLLRE
jgi:DNA (cytosine-5)-methyltransferase 1